MPPPASTSVTKNGLPAVLTYNSSASTPCGRASSSTASRESGGRRSCDTPGSGAELADGEAHRVRRFELALAIRDHDECTNRLGPPRDQANDVERRLVGPVHVLDHRDRRLHGAHFLDQRQEDGMRLLALGHGSRECTLQGRRHVDQRTERPRRREGVARPPQHPRRRAPRLAEPADQRALADARLARDEREPAGPGGDVVEALLQRFQECRALEQTALGTRVFGDRTHGGHRATPDERNQARSANWSERTGARRSRGAPPADGTGV